MGGVTRAEWRWAAVFSAVVSVLLTLPYLLAFQEQGADWRFSGFLFGVEDGNSYIADMRQGADGAWLFRIPYTTEPQTGSMIYLPYLWLGKLAGGAAMHDQLVALFHLALVAAGFAMLLSVYRFTACFIESVPLRRWALAAAAFGGGLGWILLAAHSYPLEFTSPEAFGFLSLFGLPHLAAARALFLLALAWFAEPFDAAAAGRRGVRIGLALTAVWLFQPITVGVAWAVMAAGIALMFLRLRLRREPAAVMRPRLTSWLVATAVSALPMAYSAFSFAADPVLRQWAAQNTLTSAPIGQYLLSYGPLLLPALAGAVIAWREDERWLIPLGWMIVFPLLIYLPFTVQRRLAEGFWMALIVLALRWVEKKLAGAARMAAFVAGMALLLPAAVLFTGWAFMRAAVPSKPAFLPAAEARALEWLDSQTSTDAVVVSGFAAGNAVPAYTGLLTYIGHGPETLNNREKQIRVDALFNGALDDASRLDALRTIGADYVLAGPVELATMGETLPGCELIYRKDGWEIWRVVV